MPNSRQLANAIRALSMDAVQRANSGHPGMPMGMADIAEVLWRNHLSHNPKNPNWPNRDRFVLSNGHGSMLIYSLLHLTGYDLSIDDLKNFRQLHSKTPGHPEIEEAPGIETTTGPLGQGLANAVGMAIAEQVLAANFNSDESNIVDHKIYAFCGDGCLMEGISHEVCSLAGTLGLGKLIVFYDDNGISIDGKIDGWFTDNTPERFKSYNWQVIENVDGHDSESINKAIIEAKADDSRPTLICCKTTIGFGSPSVAGTAKSHGAPLGDEEIVKAREQLNWQYAPFEIPDDIYAKWDATVRGQELESKWQKQFSAYQESNLDLANELMRRLKGDLPENFCSLVESYLQELCKEQPNVASRKASLNCLNAYGPALPELLGGSADLAGSNLTKWDQSVAVNSEDFSGNYINYGVREFGMSAIMNGIALHGGFIPYGGTFLTFSDYARNAIRMAALMKQRAIFVYTHDSIGLGEDGPTHQAVEHAAMLRLTPDLTVWRPCDAVETAVAWADAINKNGPTALLLSRQSLPHVVRNEQTVKNIFRGAYIIQNTEAKPDIIVIATGSEMNIALSVAKNLTDEGKKVRVVSMPSTEVFDSQDKEYQQSVLPAECTNRIAIEAASKDYWYKYVGLNGLIIGMDSYGASAPASVLYKHFGFDAADITKRALQLFRSEK